MIQSTLEQQTTRGRACIEIITDRFGRIVDVCDDSPLVFNLSARGLEGRALSAFVGHDRPAVIDRLEAAALGHDIVVETILRPRDRKPRPVVLHISAIDEESSYTELRWRIELLG